MIYIYKCILHIKRSLYILSVIHLYIKNIYIYTYIRMDKFTWSALYSRAVRFLWYGIMLPVSRGSKIVIQYLWFEVYEWSFELSDSNLKLIIFSRFSLTRRNWYEHAFNSRKINWINREIIISYWINISSNTW